MCTSKTNPFWWHEKQIYTDVAILRFEVENKVIESFEKPYTIYFKTNNKTSQLLKLFQTFPKRKNLGTPRTKEEEDFQTLTVFRIDVLKNTRYNLEFFNFTESDCFDVNNLYGLAF